MLAAVVHVSLIALVFGHGAMLQPRSRNSVDWLVGKNLQPCSNLTGDKCNNGQAAYWYSQGCFIGCPSCDNKSGRRQVDLCGSGKTQTLNDPKYWSLGRDAVPGSATDVYKHNPWRAPGSAPVEDACGLAGGSYDTTPGAEHGWYQETKFAKHGDIGTHVLGPIPNYTGPTYKLGATAEVSWSILNNHGGGYQYRIAPLPANFSDLKESDFKPLDFVKDEQSIVFPNGSTLRLTANQTTFVSEGTLPEGSTWSMIPMPPTLLGPCCIPGINDTDDTPNHCLPHEGGVNSCGAYDKNIPDFDKTAGCAPCPGTPGSDCSRCDQVHEILPDRYKNAPPFPEPCPKCSGVNWNGYSVRDVVKIPSELPPGKYVLGFRYDCEATAQVWSSCADVTLES